jgi:hypothetical protein
MCMLSYMHHPRFSSGSHGDVDKMQDLWATLADAGAEMMLAEHDDNDERFAPMNANGHTDPNGMRMFVAGIGGTGLRGMDISPNTEASNDNSHGVLGLDLNDGSYNWGFLPVAGDTYADQGTTTCHKNTIRTAATNPKPTIRAVTVARCRISTALAPDERARKADV